VKPGPNGTSYEHHADGSMVIRGPGGKVVGMVAPVVRSQSTLPVKPASVPANQNGQSIIDGVKTNPGFGRTAEAKTKIGTTTEFKRQTLVTRQPVAPIAHHPATGPAVTHAAARMTPAVGPNAGRSSTFAHSAPRMGGINAGRIGGMPGRFGKLGRMS
jgi:hypothetical protein